jgi:hypothetical protein
MLVIRRNDDDDSVECEDMAAQRLWYTCFNNEWNDDDDDMGSDADDDTTTDDNGNDNDGGSDCGSGSGSGDDEHDNIVRAHVIIATNDRIAAYDNNGMSHVNITCIK